MAPMLSVSTVVQPHEDPQMVVESVKAIFPDWVPDRVPGNAPFPNKREGVLITGSSESLDTLLEAARNQRILDTALDAMTLELEIDSTGFSLSRQAALAGKASFVIDERPIGGEMRIGLTGEGLAVWLEQQTWHAGRNSVPRSVGDELAMSEDGEPVEWFDRMGNRTIGGD
ncbi:hypothetical protein [Candidatus Thalassarchaeum betae]|jgi:predicted RNA binding protein with dsRBD fold (UPF0201 family)|uniref:hypothetical protein n=1 Tax=Candidatus Thalassarchaeum betae TaxID=2599289 RepID=UPI0030C73E68|nr:hypothetical protein [Candidatus Thalassoarchaea betae]